MRNIILFDDDSRDLLLPFTFTRPAAEIRCGILTIREKWAHYLDGHVSYVTQDYLSNKYPIEVTEDNFLINGHVLPNAMLVKLISQLNFNEALMFNDDLIAARLSSEQYHHLLANEKVDELRGFILDETPFVKIDRPWNIFQYNAQEIISDFKLLTKGKTSQELHTSNRSSGNQIFIEPGAEIRHSILNSESGPIYIGKNATVLEGCMIRGPFALGDNAVLKMGAKIYGGTTIGTYCKAGGEINNSILFEYSNKAHDGYLGNSVIGAWCNLGADTNTSNLKNNYGNVKVYNYPANAFLDSEQQFCGSFIGDYSKFGINSMLNTGSTIGVAANIYGAQMSRKFTPSFSWIGPGISEDHKVDKAIETAERVMKRKSIAMTDKDKSILREIYKITTPLRPA